MTGDGKVYIKKLVYGGYGIAQEGDKTLFVEYAAPNEVVKVRTIKEKKDYAIGIVEEVILPSSVRRDPPCPYYGKCGGCQLQHIIYEEQLKAKKEILLETLNKIGKLRVKELDGMLYANEFGGRIRAQFKSEKGSVGFYERMSHNLVDIEECLLLHPEINKLIPSIRELSKKFPQIKEVHVNYSPSEDEALLKLVVQEPVDKESVNKYTEHILPKKVVGVGCYVRRGSGELFKLWHIGRSFIFYNIGDMKLRVSIDSFIQVNHYLWEQFVQKAMPDNQYERVLELHCGIGFFTLHLSKRSGFVFAYDANKSAVKDAEYNARINRISNVSFEPLKALSALKKHAGDIIDLVFLDPPRSGLSEGEAKLIIQNKPKEIVYVSCEPTTFARDLKVLVEGGYSLKSLLLLDNFPNTYHIEAIAHLAFSQ